MSPRPDRCESLHGYAETVATLRDGPAYALCGGTVTVTATSRWSILRDRGRITADATALAACGGAHRVRRRVRAGFVDGPRLRQARVARDRRPRRCRSTRFAGCARRLVGVERQHERVRAEGRRDGASTWLVFSAWSLPALGYPSGFLLGKCVSLRPSSSISSPAIVRSSGWRNPRASSRYVGSFARSPISPGTLADEQDLALHRTRSRLADVVPELRRDRSERAASRTRASSRAACTWGPPRPRVTRSTSSGDLAEVDRERAVRREHDLRLAALPAADEVLQHLHEPAEQVEGGGRPRPRRARGRSGLIGSSCIAGDRDDAEEAVVCTWRALKRAGFRRASAR